MSKEYIQALNIIKFNPNDVDGLQYLEAFKVVEQALQRLEAIDNTKSNTNVDGDRLTQKDIHWLNDKKFNYCINNKIDFEKDIDENQDEKDYLLDVQTKELHFITDKLGIYEDMGSPVSIHQALQRLEAIENANPSEALECLERIEKYISDRNMYEDLKLESNMYYNGLGIIKQSLLKSQEQEKENDEYKRVFKIIKNKRVDMWDLLDQTYETYLAFCKSEGYDNEYILTEEEFDSVKRLVNTINI